MTFADKLIMNFLSRRILSKLTLSIGICLLCEHALIANNETSLSNLNSPKQKNGEHYAYIWQLEDPDRIDQGDIPENFFLDSICPPQNEELLSIPVADERENFQEELPLIYPPQEEDTLQQTIVEETFDNSKPTSESTFDEDETLQQEVMESVVEASEPAETNKISEIPEEKSTEPNEDLQKVADAAEPSEAEKPSEDANHVDIHQGKEDKESLSDVIEPTYTETQITSTDAEHITPEEVAEQIVEALKSSPTPESIQEDSQNHSEKTIAEALGITPFDTEPVAEQPPEKIKEIPIYNLDGVAVTGHAVFIEEPLYQVGDTELSSEKQITKISPGITENGKVSISSNSVKFPYRKSLEIASEDHSKSRLVLNDAQIIPSGQIETPSFAVGDKELSPNPLIELKSVSPAGIPHPIATEGAQKDALTLTSLTANLDVPLLSQAETVQEEKLSLPQKEVEEKTGGVEGPVPGTNQSSLQHVQDANSGVIPVEGASLQTTPIATPTSEPVAQPTSQPEVTPQPTPQPELTSQPTPQPKPTPQPTPQAIIPAASNLNTQPINPTSNQVIPTSNQPVPTTPGQGPQVTQAPKQDSFLINFNNVAIIEYLNFISKITNKNFIFDDADLDFKVTIVSTEPTSVTNIMSALLQELRIHGLSLMEVGNSLIIHRNYKVNSPATIVTDTDTKIPTSDLITKVFRITNAYPERIAEIIKPMLSELAIVEADPDTSHLIVTDLTSNVVKISTLIQNLDAPSSDLEIGQYVVNNASVEAAVLLAEKILAPMAKGKTLIFVPHQATNSIYVVSTPYLVEKAIAVLQHLDTVEGETRILSLEKLSLQAGGGAGGPGGPEGQNRNKKNSKWSSSLPLGHTESTKFFIKKLQYQHGEKIVDSLKKIADSLLASSNANTDLITTINSIQWLESTNSLVYTGTVESIEKVNELIDDIDIPLRQVLIEMLIIETTVDDSLNFGVDWGARFAGDNVAGSEAFLSSNSPLVTALDSAVPNNPLDNGILARNAGFALGVIGRNVTHCGVAFNSLGALVLRCIWIL